ncbi:MAG: Lacal_2735 family protein [Cytophagales bacterium]|nr:Lacal_2735 family protein [Cytophagales bacterium]
MINFFKKKSKLEILQEKHRKLLEEAYTLSTISRTKSDQKHAEAFALMEEIEALQQTTGDNSAKP